MTNRTAKRYATFTGGCIFQRRIELTQWVFTF